MPPVILSRKVGELEVLTYLVYCPRSRQGVIIDPAGEPEALAAWVEEQEMRLRYLLATHGHPDHVLGAARLRELTGAPLALHRADRDFFTGEQGRRVAAEELGLPLELEADVVLEDGQRLAVAELEVEVIHTPGHTPGSVCYLVEGNLFTGDTLFVGAVGRTDLGGASLEVLLDSLARRILPLPGETVVWPGHDYGDTPRSTLAREREENPYITDFILAD